MPTKVTKECDVLILSANLGTGHLQVSNAISESLLELVPGINISIHDFFDHVDPLFRNLIRFSYEQSIKHFSKGYDLFYQATRNVTPESRYYKTVHAIGSQKLKATMNELTPKIVVCTFPYPAGVLSMIKAKKNINLTLITVITDVTIHSQWFHPEVNEYLVPSESVALGMKTLGIDPHKISVTGIPLRKGFEISSQNYNLLDKLNLKKDLFTLLVMGGGFGLMSDTEEICSKLSKSKLPLQLIVVCGTNLPLYQKLCVLQKKSHTPMCILGYVDFVPELMDISDLLLTKAGGITIFEALSKTLPMILHNPLPGHETGNVDFVVSNNAGFLALTIEDVFDIVELLHNKNELLLEMKNSIRLISKPNASREAAKIILRYLDPHKFSNSNYSSSLTN